jgi:predicted MPP superfamily phosphohydrolase
MIRRDFFTSMLAIPIVGIGYQNSGQGKVMHVVSYAGANTISLPGYQDSLKFMQITDSHIDISDDSEKDMLPYAERMQKAYANARSHFLQPEISKKPLEYFLEALDKAVSEKVDLLLLTGDIINFPSAFTVSFLVDKLKKAGIPWLFIAGNHDWHYEGLEGSADELRKTWVNTSLLPFYRGNNPLCYSQVVKGINFVGIDNSTYQINEEQLRFFREQLVRSEPVVLVSHIPYHFNGMEGMACGNPAWGANSDRNYVIERRQRWPEEGNSKSTRDFLETLHRADEKVIAIITGHTHRHSTLSTGNLCQYVSFAAANGAASLFTIKGRENGL